MSFLVHTLYSSLLHTLILIPTTLIQITIQWLFVRNRTAH